MEKETNLMRARLMTKGYEHDSATNAWVKTRYTGAQTVVGMRVEFGKLEVIRNIHTKSGVMISSVTFSTKDMELEEIIFAL